MVMGAVKAKASRIIGIDLNPDKFKIAKEFGCTDCVNPKDFDKVNLNCLRSGNIKILIN